MTWIILALILIAAAAAGFRIQALTRDEPPEPPLAHRWRALGGYPPSSGTARATSGPLTTGSQRPR
jgi:hypothetical protein